METDESKAIMPVCRYKINEIMTIKKALAELKRHEENMLCYNKGFRSKYAVVRTQNIIDDLDNCILALDYMCQYDIMK